MSLGFHKNLFHFVPKVTVEFTLLRVSTGACTLQAAIAAVHTESSSAASTDRRQITLLCDRLIQIHPSPVVEPNRTVAIAMYEGPEQGLYLINDLLARGHLSHYHPAHSAQANVCRRLGRFRRLMLPLRRRL